MLTGFVLASSAAAQIHAGSPDLTPPLTSSPGHVQRGREVAFAPERGNCGICHLLPGADPASSGTVGPPLAGTGARHGTAWLRTRLVDGRRINPDTIMPSYHRTQGLNRVAAQWRDKPILDAQEIEDLVAWLASLQDQP